MIYTSTVSILVEIYKFCKLMRHNILHLVASNRDNIYRTRSSVPLQLGNDLPKDTGGIKGQDEQKTTA